MKTDYRPYGQRRQSLALVAVMVVVGLALAVVVAVHVSAALAEVASVLDAR